MRTFPYLRLRTESLRPTSINHEVVHPTRELVIEKNTDGALHEEMPSPTSSSTEYTS